MKQVVSNKGRIELRDVAQPLMDEHMVLVQVHYSCISPGTETATLHNAQESVFHKSADKIKKIYQAFQAHGFAATKDLITTKLQGNVQALGYACSGQIIAVGAKVLKLRVGDYVACAGSRYANHAELVCVPENLVAKLKNKDLLKAASLTTLGAIALQGIRRAQLQVGEFVCVIGLGLLGHLTVQLAKLSGCTVIGIDILPERLDLAAQVGADYVFDARALPENDIAYITQHYGVDCTIITASSASHELMQQAMRITRKKGKIVIVGDVGLHLKREPFYQKEIDVLMSCSYGPGRYDNAYERESRDYPYAYVRWTEQRNMQAFISLLEQNKLKLDALINTECALESVEEAYKLLEQKKLSVIFSYNTSACSTESKQLIISDVENFLDPARYTFLPKIQGEYRVAIIGAGGFPKTTLLPILSRIKSVKITALIEPDIGSALTVAKGYDIEHVYTQPENIYKQDLADVVVIASPHVFHAQQAMEALKHGKAVFLEKPMVTTWQQYHAFAALLEKYPNAPLCVDYNRSFSPFIQTIKGELKNRNTPLIITYRMNVGFIPNDHWTQQEIGGGRLIGEACHIIDLFHYLTDAQVISMAIEGIHTSSVDINASDNFCAILRFDDGSIANLIYTALGHASAGKEFMEIFYQGKIITLNDYKTLTAFGIHHFKEQKTKYADKGHEALIKKFIDTIITVPYEPPISYKQMLDAARIALQLHDFLNDEINKITFKI